MLFNFNLILIIKIGVIMKPVYYFLSLFIISAVAISCTNTNQSPTVEEVESAIESNFRNMGEAMQNGDAATFASYFTEDAFFKLPGQNPVEGREAIQNVHQGMINQGLGIRPSTGEVELYGDHAVELGTVDILGPDGSVVNKAYYLTVWKNVEGEWKIYQDVVSDLPMETEETDTN